jgi:hypothetical protein
MAKQPCSRWPAEGETRPSKRHDKVPSGASKQPVRTMRNPAASLGSPASAGTGASRAPRRWAKAMDGAKSLELQPLNPPGYGGRNGCTADYGTGEIRLGTGSERPRVANPRRPVAAKPISSDPAKRRSAERKSEGAIGSWDGVDNTTRRSEGPLAECASRTGTAAGLPRRDRGHSPAHREVTRSGTGNRRLGRPQRRGAAECVRSTARERAK